MAKYIYKNTHFFFTMDPKRIIEVSLKVLYAGWDPTACYSMTFADLYISSSPRAVATGSHHEKPILPKIMRQKSFNTINHWIQTFIIPSRDNTCVLISVKRANSRKMSHLRRTLHKEIETFALHLRGERAENAIYFKTIKPIEIARSKEVGAWN